MDNVMQFGGISSVDGGEVLSGKDGRRYDLLGARARILRAAVEAGKLKRYGITSRSAIVRCHVAPIGGMVEVKAGEGRARYSNVVTCGNPLCPVCGARIMRARAAEIRDASYKHMHQGGGELYMLTVTIRHTAADSLTRMLSRLDVAWRAYRHDKRVRSALWDAALGYVRSTEVQYSRANGFHPHYHVLFFLPAGWVLDGAILDALKRAWCAVCARAGLDASYAVGCNVERVERVGQYLTKISGEMALTQNKEGRGSDGHYSHLQLLDLARCGVSWAADAALAEIVALRGRHLLYWSVGLKSRFGIGDVSDEEICAASEEGEALAALVHSRAWRCLSWSARGVLLDAVAAGAGVVVPLDDGRGHRFIVRDYGGIPLVVVAE